MHTGHHFRLRRDAGGDRATQRGVGVERLRTRAVESAGRLAQPAARDGGAGPVGAVGGTGREQQRDRGASGAEAADRGQVAQRFVAQRVIGLHDELRPGRPRTYGDEQVAELINQVLRSKPQNATHWSVRSVARRPGIAKSTVARYFALFGLQPHRSKSFKLSTDPFFVEKVRDVVGLYLNPPDKALVLCVDEKIQIQALEHTQLVLPLGLGYVEGVTHDYLELPRFDGRCWACG